MQLRHKLQVFFCDFTIGRETKISSYCETSDLPRENLSYICDFSFECSVSSNHCFEATVLGQIISWRYVLENYKKKSFIIY